MKKLLLFITVLTSLFLHAQQYPSYNISLIGSIAPNVTDAANDNRRYSGCWGWYQQNKNKEYAISGTSKGTYFIDVTSPATPSICAYVAGGRAGCIWREIKTYQHYCYVVSDDPAPNRFQIIDMQYLPDSVHVVYSSNSLFERAHTIWIDHDKLYAGGVTYISSSPLGSSPMAVYSLANPEQPTLLRRFEQDFSSTITNYVHDMYVRNDTVYASCAYQGLLLFKFNTSSNTLSQLGSYTGYPFAGYNHSSALTKNGKYMVFCDESPASLPIHLIDVENFSNIQPIQNINPYQGTTPHNPYILGNDFAVVSCYQDGLMILNISQPAHVAVVGYFDTYPQGGHNTGSYDSPNDYRGNWGAYPYLPSGIIIAQDMQNGVFILDGTHAFNNPLGIKTNAAPEINLACYPNPVSEKLAVSYNTTAASVLQLKDLLGRIVIEKNYMAGINDYIDVSGLESGSYIISVTENNRSKNKQIIINH